MPQKSQPFTDAYGFATSGITKKIKKQPSTTRAKKKGHKSCCLGDGSWLSRSTSGKEPYVYC